MTLLFKLSLSSYGLFDFILLLFAILNKIIMNLRANSYFLNQ